MAINYDYLKAKIAEQKLPNAQVRNEAMRMANQDPGAFYSKYGYPPPTPAQTASPTAPTQAYGPSLADSFNPTPYSNGDISGMSRDGPTSQGGTYGGKGGGLFGNDPRMGGLIGAGLNAAGAPFGGILGQMASGTPQSQRNAFASTAMNSVLGAAGAGKFAGPIGMGIQSLVNGKMPSLESTLMTAAMMTPLAPLAQAYGFGKGVVGYLSDREQQNLNNETSVNNIMGPIQSQLGVPATTGKPSGFLSTLGSLFGNAPNSYAQDSSPLGMNSLGGDYGIGGDMGFGTAGDNGAVADAFGQLGTIDSNPDPYGLSNMDMSVYGNDSIGGFGGYGGDGTGGYGTDR